MSLNLVGHPALAIKGWWNSSLTVSGWLGRELADGGQEVISATLIVIEADDTVSSTVTLLVQASAAVTEANDTLSATATVLVQANASITEANDSIASTAAVLVQASAAIVEDDDAISATASISADPTAGQTVLGGSYNRHEIDKAVKEYLNRKKRRALKFATTGPAYKQALAAEVAKAGNDDDEIILMLLAA